MNSIIIIIIILVILFVLYLLFKKTDKSPYGPLSIMSSVDLGKYAGMWYEIARLPVPFEDSDNFTCLNARAFYSVNYDKTLSIINTCNTIKGPIQVTGLGTPINPPKNNSLIVSPAVLSVKFTNSPDIGTYNIIYVDPNYQTALVGTSDRKTLWLLSRTANPDDSLIQNLLQIAKSNQFSLDKLKFNSN